MVLFLLDMAKSSLFGSFFTSVQKMARKTVQSLFSLSKTC